MNATNRISPSAPSSREVSKVCHPATPPRSNVSNFTLVNVLFAKITETWNLGSSVEVFTAAGQAHVNCSRIRLRANPGDDERAGILDRLIVLHVPANRMPSETVGTASGTLLRYGDGISATAGRHPRLGAHDVVGCFRKVSGLESSVGKSDGSLPRLNQWHGLEFAPAVTRKRVLQRVVARLLGAVFIHEPQRRQVAHERFVFQELLRPDSPARLASYAHKANQYATATRSQGSGLPCQAARQPTV